ncbi:MAG: hypothetical protein PHZ26_04135 [Candidatus Gracilibacteria bacterium]|nr:hypothetical protein [Candidatus Gracilibacteria bacterium]MDD2908917.1 hypothetical protein [Candidatus Gracilibacteria bacterium]
MKKIILISVLTTSIILVSCTNPFTSQSQRGTKGIGGAKNGGAPNDIIRLKSRSGDKMGSGNLQRFGSGSERPNGQRSGSGSRIGSGSINSRFPQLTEEDRQKLTDSMEARRLGDTAKSDEIMKELEAKYPSVFSGSTMIGGLRGTGTGAIK